MTRLPETTDAAEIVTDTGERAHAWKRVATVAALGTVSVGAFIAQHNGLTQDIDQPFLRATVESLSHPMLGYIGAYIGINALARLRGNRRFQAAAAITGATLVNFATEFAQDISVGGGNGTNFMMPEHTGETIKDYAFALGGVGLYLLQGHMWRKNSEQKS